MAQPLTKRPPTEGRRNKRNYLASAASGFVSTAVSVVTAIVSVPIALSYWGTESYGLWTVVTSILVYLGISNLGLSAAATTHMGKGKNYREKISVFKRSLRMLLVVVVVAGIGFLCGSLLFPKWVHILGKMSPALEGDAFLACLILGSFFLINMPFSLITSAFQGFQKAYVENMFGVLSSVVNLMGLVVVVWLSGSLVLFAVISGLGNLVVNLARLGAFYYLILRDEKSSCGQVESASSGPSDREILTTGLRLVSIGLAATIVWNTDYLVISNLLGVQQVASYSVALKLYQMMFSVMFLVNASVFPLMAREFAAENWSWIAEKYQALSMAMLALGGLIWVGGVAFMYDVIQIWTGAIGYPGWITVWALGGYAYLIGAVNLHSGMIQAFNFIRGVSFVGWAEALVKIGLSVSLVGVLGVGGVAFGAAVASLVTAFLVLPVLLRKRSCFRLTLDRRLALRHFAIAIAPCLLAAFGIQLTVQNQFLRLIIAFLLVLVYLVVTVLLIPKQVRIQLLAFMGLRPRVQ